jgi:mRNA deadenylase 3'-5' endonuclease subunit Ccr4
MVARVGTYNVLAPSYIRREWYPFTPVELLDSSWRLPALSEHLIRLAPDLLCLQEVEADWFSELETRLSRAGYASDYCAKGRGKPDGCAAFYRTELFTLLHRSRLEFDDEVGRQPASGHVAQFLVFTFASGTLGVANTHLKWDAPNTAPEGQYGLRQVRQLLEARSVLGPDCAGWLICGDLNVTPGSEVVCTLQAAGFAASHPLNDGSATCNSNRRAKQLDYIFHDRALTLVPCPQPRVSDETPLPGSEQPSDHVAVLARCAWRSAQAR